MSSLGSSYKRFFFLFSRLSCVFSTFQLLFLFSLKIQRSTVFFFLYSILWSFLTVFFSSFFEKVGNIFIDPSSSYAINLLNAYVEILFFFGYTILLLILLVAKHSGECLLILPKYPHAGFSFAPFWAELIFSLL